MPQLGDGEEVKGLDSVSRASTTGHPPWEVPKGSLVGLCISCSSPEGWRMMVEARKERGHQLSSPCEGDGTLPGMRGWQTCLCTSSHVRLSESETLLCCSPSIYCSVIFAVTPEKISPSVFSISLQDLPSW